MHLFEVYPWYDWGDTWSEGVCHKQHPSVSGEALGRILSLLSSWDPRINDWEWSREPADRPN